MWIRSLTVCLLVGMMPFAALAADNVYVQIYGVGNEYCSAFVKVSDDNISLNDAERTPGQFSDLKFYDSAALYAAYIGGAAQEYQRENRVMFVNNLSEAFFGAVNYCRAHPSDKVSAGVTAALDAVKFIKPK